MDVRAANPGAVADTNRKDFVVSDGSGQRRSQSPGSNTAQRRCLGEGAIADETARVWPESERSHAVDSGLRPFLPAEQGINVNGRFSARLPFLLIGLLLATTAIAKLWMLLTDSFADIRVGIPGEILWLSVAFEIWLAYENFRIRERCVLALINTVVSTSFAIFASVRWLLGYGSCGCAGKLELPAWIFIVVDLAIVAWFTGSVARLTQLRGGVRELVRWWGGCSPEVRGRWVGVALFGGAILAIQLPLAAPLRAALLGVPPIQATVRMDRDLIIAQESSGQAELGNRSSQPARIVGMNRSCRCFWLQEQPASKQIPAGGRISLPLVIQPEKAGPLHQRVVLYLEHPEQFQVIVDVVGHVRE